MQHTHSAHTLNFKVNSYLLRILSFFPLRFCDKMARVFKLLGGAGEVLRFYVIHALCLQQSGFLKKVIIYTTCLVFPVVWFGVCHFMYFCIFYGSRTPTSVLYTTTSNTKSFSGMSFAQLNLPRNSSTSDVP